MLWKTASGLEGQETMPQRVVGWHQKSPHKGAAGAGEAQLRLRAPLPPSMRFAFSPNPLDMVAWAKWASPLSPACIRLHTPPRRSGQAHHAEVLRNNHLRVPHLAAGTHVFFFPNLYLQLTGKCVCNVWKEPSTHPPTCCRILCWRKLGRCRRKEEEKAWT